MDFAEYSEHMLGDTLDSPSMSASEDAFSFASESESEEVSVCSLYIR